MLSSKHTQQDNFQNLYLIRHLDLFSGIYFNLQGRLLFVYHQHLYASISSIRT